MISRSSVPIMARIVDTKEEAKDLVQQKLSLIAILQCLNALLNVVVLAELRRRTSESSALA